MPLVFEVHDTKRHHAKIESSWEPVYLATGLGTCGYYSSSSSSSSFLFSSLLQYDAPLKRLSLTPQAFSFSLHPRLFVNEKREEKEIEGTIGRSVGRSVIPSSSSYSFCLKVFSSFFFFIYSFPAWYIVSTRYTWRPSASTTRLSTFQQVGTVSVLPPPPPHVYNQQAKTFFLFFFFLFFLLNKIVLYSSSSLFNDKEQIFIHYSLPPLGFLKRFLLNKKNK